MKYRDVQTKNCGKTYVSWKQLFANCEIMLTYSICTMGVFIQCVLSKAASCISLWILQEMSNINWILLHYKTGGVIFNEN